MKIGEGWCEPATSLIARLGGIPAVSRATGFGENWIYKWRLPRSRGGTGGRIPPSGQEALLLAAQRGEIEVTPEDFFRGIQPTMPPDPAEDPVIPAEPEPVTQELRAWRRRK